MGVRDNVIGTMQSSNAQAAERLPDWKGKGKPEDMAISASQQYKQAGNSIVVDVLAHIYEQPKERLALSVHQLKKRSVGGGVDAIERAIGIASIQLAVLADSAALVVRVSHIKRTIRVPNWKYSNNALRC